MGQYLGLLKGSRDIETDSFNPFGALIYKQNAKDVIEPLAARTFLELSSQQLIPAWAISQVDVKQLRAAAAT